MSSKRSIFSWYPLTGMQSILALFLLVVLFTTISLNRHTQDLQDVIESEAEFQAAVIIEETRQAQLVATLEFGESEAAVEHLFRNEANMVKSGEHRIIPRIVYETPEPTPAAAPVGVSEADVKPWHLWWRLLSDAPFPQGSADVPSLDIAPTDN